VIVDDASADNTEAIVKSYQEKIQSLIYYKNNLNLGIVKSRNLALSLAQGKYIAVLDSDDIWIDKDKLKKQVEFLGKFTDTAVVGAQVKIIDDNSIERGNINYCLTDKEIRKKMLLHNQFIHSSVMFERVDALAVGGYGDYLVGEDYDLFLKLGLVGKLANLSETMVSYRKHALGVTWRNRVLAARGHFEVIRRYRGRYPSYYLAMIKAVLRIFLAKLGLI
jgi:glycosyltransferase involved in cell wall biosynthesis